MRRCRASVKLDVAGAFWATPLGLPVVVAGTDPLVAIISWGHTEALAAALVAKEEAWFLVLGLRASPVTLRGAFWKKWQNVSA
ncbi:hypothetical protein M5K25_022990 [Dendrobium thyrsiflorum]|uniref:Uncharacterized protein n=1 Tax=Dendrobium thyrsiflorum TaxID=117978 RepID=A0ABD0U768_DENTH